MPGVLTTLIGFNGSASDNPRGSLIVGSNGDLFGTTNGSPIVEAPARCSRSRRPAAAPPPHPVFWPTSVPRPAFSPTLKATFLDVSRRV
jgi:hypothetical protein